MSPGGNLEDSGFALIPQVFEASDLLSWMPKVSEGVAGRRDLHELPWIRGLTANLMSEIVRPALGCDASVVRILYFDKQPGSNWALPFHQDLTIAVRERIEIEGFGPWSVKDGIVHVQPPVDILESMIAVRLHADDCSSENGALRVIPGSHLRGKLTASQVDEAVRSGEEVIVEASAGDVLLMRPLLLHASSPALAPSHRRVLHIEYCAAALPESLQWFLGWKVAQTEPAL